MSIAFVHLSDIHFGQERGGKLKIHDDVKARLIEDVMEVCSGLPDGRAAGIIVTGDTAYGGTAEEYNNAAAWLDKVAGAAGCAITDIQVVPGNHDVDRKEITSATEMMISEIMDKGEVALDRFLEAEADRALLYRRFRWYQPFAEAYRCPLDTTGGLAEERVAELAKGRFIRFVRVNSALICSKKDEKGKLILGARQRVLPKNPGEEIIVLCHHPLDWLQDGEEAKTYIESRARVFISGHEHDPSLKIINVEDGCELMMLASGATVPPDSDDKFTFTYNVLEFDWDEKQDGLAVTVHPRAWDRKSTKFAADDVRLGGSKPTFTLGCPNFRGDQRPKNASLPFTNPIGETEVVIIPTSVEAAASEKEGGHPMAENYPLLLLRFFRDLTPVQRLKILIDLGAIPATLQANLTQAIERRAFEKLVKEGHYEALDAAVKSAIEAMSERKL